MLIRITSHNNTTTPTKHSNLSARNFKPTISFKATPNHNSTMAFFPRNFYNTSNDTSFTPLFRLLDDFDSYSRQVGNNSGHGVRRATPTWQPKFDIRETGEAYELHGELPGMTKDNVHIEFAEPQTMLIRGKVERTYTAGSPPAGAVEDTTMSGAITEGSEGDKSPKPRRATVSDEKDEEFTEVEKDGDRKAVEKSATADRAKYWLTERSIGEFSRTFNFPARVDQNSVSASLKDGILSVTVPKAKKHEAVRISVN